MKLSDRVLEKMRRFILRPLALFSLSFYILSCFIFNIGGRELLPAAGLFLSCSVIFFVFFLIFRKNTKKKALFFALCMLFAGISLSLFTNYGNFKSNIEPYFAYEGKTTNVSGTVTEVLWEKPYGAQYKTDISRIDGNNASVKMLLSADAGLSVGDTFSASDTEISLISDKNGAPLRESSWEYYFSEGVILSGEAEKAMFTGTQSSVMLSVTKLRGRLVKILIRTLGEDSGGFSAALLLGDKTFLSERVHRDYKRIGVSHILAISGMHLAVICMMIQFVFRGVNIHLRRIITAITVIGYMVLTGFPASVTRSGIMMLILLLCQCLKKSSDTVTAIGLAAFLICFIDPFSAGDVGLKLSVASVVAIALSTGQMTKSELKPMKKHRSRINSFFKSIGQAIFVGVCVVIFLLPLQWEYFGYISPVSPFASVILSFLSSLILYLLPILLLLSPVKALAGIVAFAVNFLCRLCFRIAGELSEIPHICVSILFDGAFILCVAAFVLLIIWALSKKKTRIISGILCISVFIGLIGTAYINCRASADTADITLVNDKKNDAVVLDLDGSVTVIDIGNGYSPVLTKAADAAKNCGATEIETLILTHLHKSHTSTLSSFFDRNMVRILAVPDTAVEDSEDKEILESIAAVCSEKGVGFLYFPAFEAVHFTENSAIQFHQNSYIKRSVQPSVRFDIILPDRTVTYVGASYTDICPDAEFDCDILLIGSHGPLYKKEFSADISGVSHIISTEYAEEFLPFTAKKTARVQVTGGGIKTIE